MRPNRDDYFLSMAKLVSTRSTCLRRSVGCVLVNSRNHVLSTGYNGVAAGMAHCNEADPFSDIGYPNACGGAAAKSGEDLHLCKAIHAEQNALLQCRDVYAIDTCYVTVSPCMHCMKLLMNTSCQRIVAYAMYDMHAIELWRAMGRKIEFAIAQKLSDV